MQAQILEMISNWEGKVQEGNTCYNTGAEYTAVISRNKPSFGQIHVKLLPKQYGGLKTEDKRGVERSVEPVSSPVYRLKVKKYMTEPSSPGFDFMEKWNGNVPMPLRIMTGTVEKETKGMYKMHLTGLAEATCTCMRCGRTLTNPISKKYGIGPECMQKVGFIGVDIDDVETIEQKLTEVKWTGWVIKSAIQEWEEV